MTDDSIQFAPLYVCRIEERITLRGECCGCECEPLWLCDCECDEDSDGGLIRCTLCRSSVPAYFYQGEIVRLCH